MRFILLFSLMLLLLLLAGCGHKETTASVPPPPDLPPQPSVTAKPAPPPVENRDATVATPTVPAPTVTKPAYTELGLASWYGAPYHNRRGSNGEAYDMNAMTAAHRTLPLNSVVRVTNVKTGKSAVVRITDRGPFIGERILDLSLAAAKAVDVWEPGTAWVRLELLGTPAPLDSGGKWAVQIGAFDTREAAMQMRQSVIDLYHPSDVREFTGPTGEWVRIRVQNDDRELAKRLSQSVTTPEGGVFLVRLD